MRGLRAPPQPRGTRYDGIIGGTRKRRRARGVRSSIQTECTHTSFPHALRLFSHQSSHYVSLRRATATCLLLNHSSVTRHRPHHPSQNSHLLSLKALWLFASGAAQLCPECQCEVHQVEKAKQVIAQQSQQGVAGASGWWKPAEVGGGLLRLVGAC